MSEGSPQFRNNINEDTAKKKMFQCDACGRTFSTKGGRTNHQRKCKNDQNPGGNSKLGEENEKPEKENEDIIVVSNGKTTDVTSKNASDQQQHPSFTWGIHDDYKYVEKTINRIYNKIVYWKRNLFMLPFGKSGKTYIDQVTYLLNEWLHDSPLSNISIKMVMPQLLLQKPSKSSKMKDHIAALNRRMELWVQGDFQELFEEGKAIQESFKTSSSKQDDITQISKRFLTEMQKGNINGAIKLLTNNMENGILPLNENTLELLRQKHPTEKEPQHHAILPDEEKPVHPIKFEKIDAEMVRKAALKTKGGAGPSGLVANGWCRMLTSNSYGKSSSDLCKVISDLIKRLCTHQVNSESIEALLASRLIPLDKNPGLRPIGVGEILRRIAGKVVVNALKEEIVSSVGSLQTCAGHEAGCESVIHAIREKFEEDETEAVLLVDASNAFNSVNRKVFLNNVGIICPSLATFVRNCYSNNLRIFIVGGVEISSREGTTQADPAAMAIYAIAIIPLILMLVEATLKTSTVSAGYADDLTAAGMVRGLKIWWDKLSELGPGFGYFPEATKSWIIVKEQYEDLAREVFGGTGVKITNEGKRHLRAVIGSNSYRTSYVEEKIDKLINQVKILSKIAKIEPQAAYKCFVSGLKHKSNYIMRTIPGIEDQLKRLDQIITTDFIPAISDGILCSPTERRLIALPAKLGGLGIPIFSEIARDEFKNSCEISEDQKDAIILQESQIHRNETKSKAVRSKIRAARIKKQTTELESIKQLTSEYQQRLIDLKEEGYVIAKNLFWDLIRLRYGWNLKRMPTRCECGSNFNIEHALSCKKGGFVSLRHNHLRNITCNFLNQICNDVSVEPMLHELTGEEFTEKSSIKTRRHVLTSRHGDSGKRVNWHSLT